MKVFIVLLSVVAFVASEAPSYNQRYALFGLQRIEAPYPAAGTRPSNEFRLPERQYLPPQSYGPPQETTTEQINTTTDSAATTTELPTTTEQQSEQIKEDELTEQGAYYIYHPSGLLQRVVYSTKNNVKDMGYTAQLRYQDVAPLKDPIYTYDAETLTFKQLFK